MHDFLLWPIIGNRGILLISNSETCFYHDCNLAIEETATICLVASSPCIRFNVIYTACSFIIGWCLLVTQKRTLPRIGTLQKSRKTQYIAMHQWPKSLCAWNSAYCNITQQQDIFHKAHITLVNLHLYNRYRLMPCSAERKTKLLQKITAKGARTTHKEVQHLLPNMCLRKEESNVER